jgi:hypothetical protein
MKKTLITVALTAVVVLTLVGLASSSFSRAAQFNDISSSLSGYGGGGGAPELYAEAPASAPMEGIVSKEMMVDLAANQSVVDTNRLVIKNADLAIVVKDPESDLEKIRNLADEMGGYVVASNTYKTTAVNNISVNEITITIRVPESKLDDALARIKQGAVDVEYESTSGVDVTSEYVDLKSRLAAKEEAEKQLLKIMEKAETAEEVLAVYMQVQNIQTEIEMLKGQIKYYEESSQMSSISVRLIPERGSQPVDVSPWSPSGAWKESLAKLDAFAKDFADFLINLVGFVLPALVLVILPLAILFFGGRFIYRRFAKPKVVVQAEEKK